MVAFKPARVWFQFHFSTFGIGAPGGMNDSTSLVMTAETCRIETPFGILMNASKHLNLSSHKPHHLRRKLFVLRVVYTLS